MLSMLIYFVKMMFNSFPRHILQSQNTVHLDVI